MKRSNLAIPAVFVILALALILALGLNHSSTSAASSNSSAASGSSGRIPSLSEANRMDLPQRAGFGDLHFYEAQQGKADSCSTANDAQYNGANAPAYFLGALGCSH